MILSSMGIEDAEPPVLHMLLEFAHSKSHRGGSLDVPCADIAAIRVYVRRLARLSHLCRPCQLFTLGRSRWRILCLA